MMNGINYNMEELLPLVEKLTIQYTSNESSSITYETAKMLLSAIVYCIREDAQAREHGDADLDPEEVHRKKLNLRMSGNNKSAKDAYEEGYGLVIKKVKKALVLYNHIMEDFRAYENIAYYDTVVKGMPAFFQYYDAKFNPENHILTLDYPTIKSVHHLSGIDAIYQYLEYIFLEQLFLKAFSEDVIIRLLKRFDENYNELFINAASIVLENAAGCFLAQKQISSLKIEKEDLTVIKEFVQGKNKAELKEKINEIIHTIIKHVYGGNTALYKYLSADADDFSVRLLTAAENNCLDSLFPVESMK
ncbi:DUF6179 domain-containing protein [Clostridium aminobutyricum]|uniref:Uncharacterized protein n=1 Tax=Clostridium aminobutyricum TaxID=33953 RepID=A0A939IG97_CLOAM|nr:DUF6179 domain-containing protein [Clostridium aminobutyricum]MBN7772945.1 hypothetical protein [Clostridium aminobutyricum]